MDQFLASGKLLIGINYWASDNALHMWDDYHPDTVERDLHALAACGVRSLRIFPLWSSFQPLTAAYSNEGIYEIQLQGKPLPDTEAGRAGVSEQACAHFAHFCDTAHACGMSLTVALVTGHMSGRYFAPEALAGRNPLTDPTAVKWQLRFVRYFVRRFGTHPAVAAWDLGNEMNGFARRTDTGHRDNTYLWANLIADAVRTVDDGHHPILTGFDFVGIENCPFSLYEVGEYADFNTVHPYAIFHTPTDPLVSFRPILDGVFRCRLSDGLSGVPSFIQEVGAIGYLTCSERTEADFYRALLYAAWSHDCRAVMWWCAHDQGMQSDAPYDWNNIGSDYGFLRADGSQKPVAREAMSFTAQMQALPFDTLPAPLTDAVCIVPRTQGRDDVPTLRAAWCLAKQAGLDVTFAGYDSPLPESQIYLLPSLDSSRAITRRRLMALLDRVRAGATLYLSLGRALFRMIPELTGVTFAYREAGAAEQIDMDGVRMTVKSDYRYHPEQTDAESVDILARAADGRAVYTRHRYGKGYIYLSTVPMEKHLASDGKAFRADGQDHSVWYRALTETAPGARILSADSHVVCVTEHVFDDTHRCAVLLNCSERPITTRLTLRDRWRLASAPRGTLADDTLHLNSCDAAIVMLERN